ncbi:hypothetical protein NCG89_08760 [Spongiibacter taiwanensis]|uniref:hypothetical protein n=1 Tax=Spongiibacter taiwanensis TaxID=1748242 RepID=UPI00203643AD|nr:hypothetical protein [Spongiibacter taiwanensis]USA41610.1 hypothetical protein NCG89_08760 [Spongiibacter taiwanensis]
MTIKPAFRKLILPLAVSASLAACGGGGGGGGGGGSSAEVSGTSSKGIIVGGIVNAYPISDTGEVDRLTPLAEPATTGEDGSYSLELNGDYEEGTAIFLEITAVDGTVMKCDLVQCAEDVGFGDTYPLASNFSLSGVLPSASGDSVSANLTPLTDIAAKLTLQRVLSGARASDAAAGANAQVAGRLGIVGSLIGQPIVDLTSAEAVNGASKEALENNLRATGAIAAALADNPGATVEQALTAFVTQFSDGGIAPTEESDSAATTLEEMLQEALLILDKIKGLDGVDTEGENITQTSTSVANAETAAASGGTQQSQGDIPVTSEGLAAAKLFVKQIRDLANAGELTENQQAFADEVSLAAAAVDGDAGAVAEAMALSLVAIGGAVEAYYDALDNEQTPPSTFTAEGITVAISSSGGTTTYVVDQDVVVGETTVAVDLSASDGSDLAFDETENGDTTVWTADITLDLSLSGSAATDNVSLAIDEGSSLSGDFDNREEETFTGESDPGYEEEWDNDFSVTDLNAQLSVTLEQLTGDNPVAFTGSMGLEIGSATIVEDGRYENGFQNDAYFEEEEYTETIEIDDASFTLSGEFSDANGNELSASLTAMLSNFGETCSLSRSENYDSLEFTYEDECTDEETANDYAAASLSISFSVDLAGVADDIAVDFDASRTGLETGKGTLNLSYGGMQLNFSYEGGQTLTVSNHDDVIMSLTEDEETNLSGTISQNDVKYADIDDESGTVVIRYTDGTFESAL